MKPAFNVATRDPVRDLHALQALLNRESFRTQHMVVPVDPYRTAEREPTYYADVHWPFEDGEVLRRARFLCPVNYRYPRTGPWVRVAIGIRGPGTFRQLGIEWDSRIHSYEVGTPFTLIGEDVKIPPGSGVVARIMRLDFPTTPLLGASVEVSIGYQGDS